MATVMGTTTTKDAAHEPSVWTRLEALGADVRKVRQTIAESRHATEEFVSSAAAEVQAHPVRTIALATAAGATMGCLTGFFLRGRTATPPAAPAEEAWIRIL